YFFFSSRRRHTRFSRDWSSDVCSSDLGFGLYLMEAAFGDLGVMATWRGTRSVGFRFGIAEQNFDDDIAIFGGVDFSGTLTRASRSEERRVGKEGRARLATND